MEAYRNIEQIKKMLDELPKSNKYGKIGICITTHNRTEIFKKTYQEVKRFLPEGAVLKVIDDASEVPVPEADYRFNKNVGIARAKNMGFQLLYLEGCEHFFSMDDDFYPVANDWYVPYLEAGEKHLLYIFKDFANGVKLNDTKELYRDSKKVAWSHPRGVMLYCHRYVLDTIGGMNPIFGRYCHEHVEWSDRIFNVGLTSFKYQDVVNSAGLFFSDDEQNQNRNSTIKGQERVDLIKRNTEIYKSLEGSKDFIPFIEKENLFITTYFINVKDTQGRTWKNTLDPLMPLIKSVKNTRLIILHDCFEDSQIDTLNQYKVTFVKVETSWNPYFQRWLSVREYLMKNRLWIENILMIDGTDCIIQREPRWNEMAGIYTGDEPDLMEDTSGWLRKHHQHPKMIAFLDEYGKNYQLLNAGVFGAPVDTAIEFMRLMIDLYCELGNTQTTDMMCYQYVLRMHFNWVLTYGREITTTFKKNETNNYSIVKHK